ncbi:MAG: DNA-methyltransferase [Planctomycetota bacterium]|jgi:site-specific DNA-methyltransferase (adenine-specific)
MQKPLNKIICGDCIEILSKVRKPFADLIFADPPFNIGYKYDKYNDKVKSKNYIAWTKDWMAACKKALMPDGSFYIAIGDEYAANIKIIADELGLFMRNWIIWHYTFGQQMKKKFARSHTHIFYFVNDKTSFTFNDKAVRVPSDRQLIYNDRRANPAGKMPDDVWSEYSRVCGTFKERTGWHPCQMPESLLKRIIAVSSNPGDCILDPFSGSGTTAVAAYQLDRNYVALDISEKYVENAKQRLAELKKRNPTNLFLNTTELNELKRLVSDIRRPAKQITSDKNLLELVTNQFAVRMCNHKQYSKKEIAMALKGIAD